MAINTATIQHRRGSLDDFNPEKLTPGELAVITDERSVYMGFPGGEAEKIVLEKDFTSESIKEKLGYEPADEERVDQLFSEIEEETNRAKNVENELAENATQLRVEVDTLNNGGLNLKEDFIGQQVNEWLDEHPEATTTVQDGSLETSKFTDNAKIYVIKDYVSPEMFGAVGDGVTDDSVAINNAIQYCHENKKPLYFSLGKQYAIDSPINLIATVTNGKQEVSIYGNKATIKAISSMEYMIYVFYNQNSSGYLSLIKDLTIDANSLANSGIYVEYSVGLSLENIKIDSPLEYGVYVKGGYEILATKLYFNNTSYIKDTVALYSAVGDSHYTDIIVKNYHTGFIFNKGITEVTRCHFWIYDTKNTHGIVEGSRAIETNGTLILHTEGVYVDSYQYGIYINDYANPVIENNNFSMMTVNGDAGFGNAFTSQDYVVYALNSKTTQRVAFANSFFNCRTAWSDKVSGDCGTKFCPFIFGGTVSSDCMGDNINLPIRTNNALFLSSEGNVIISGKTAMMIYVFRENTTFAQYLVDRTGQVIPITEWDNGTLVVTTSNNFCFEVSVTNNETNGVFVLAIGA